LIIKCVAAFLDFCYLARRSSHYEDVLISMAHALQSFHEHRVIFKEAGIAADNVALPRQHALDHYITGITLFGSPNGLCTSIMESKHIRAVKEPWRRSSKHNALGQILEINQRLDKLSAARVDFTARGLLEDSIMTDTLRSTGQLDDEDGADDANDNISDDEDDAGRADGPQASSHVEMARRNGVWISTSSLYLT
jgi:alcohol dehydrogenase class IV